MVGQKQERAAKQELERAANQESGRAAAREPGIAFQIHEKDNVATVLQEVQAGEQLRLTGESDAESIKAATKIPSGHKIALRDIRPGEDIVKYGVTIGRATIEILKGSWVHLHVMKSNYDERSAHLDLETGAPTDTVYE